MKHTTDIDNTRTNTLNAQFQHNNSRRRLVRSSDAYEPTEPLVTVLNENIAELRGGVMWRWQVRKRKPR